MKIPFFILTWALLSCYSIAATTNGLVSIKLLGTPIIALDTETGSGEATIYLHNDSTAKADIMLLGIPTDAQHSVGVKLTFSGSATAAADNYPVSMAANSTISIRMTASDFSDWGDANVDLVDTLSGAKIGAIKLTRGLSLSPDTSPGGLFSLSLIDHETTQLTLRNDDSRSHVLRWSLWSSNSKLCEGHFILLPKRTSVLNCTPELRWQLGRLGNLIRPSKKQGGYQLRIFSDVTHHSAADSSPAEETPLKMIPVEASVDYFSPTTQKTFSWLTILFVLTLGGISSLILSYLLPNRLKRLDVLEKLEALTKSIADLSTRIDSKLGVLVRLERSHICDVLRSRNALSLEFGSVLSQVEAATTTLAMRVELLHLLDGLQSRLDKRLICDVAPSSLVMIEITLQKVTTTLEKNQPTAAELDAARSWIKDIADLIEGLDQPNASFAQELAQEIHTIVPHVSSLLNTPTFTNIDKVVPGPYRTIKSLDPLAQTVEPTFVVAYDLAFNKIKLMLDYVSLVEGTNDPAMRARLKHRESKLVGFLQLGSLQALASARLLIREMRDDIFPERLIEALAASPAQVSISIDPQVAYEQARLDFCVCFHAKALNAAAARDEWRCSWKFGDDLEEKGWSVSHYFLLPKTSVLDSLPKSWPGLKKIVSLMKSEPKTFNVSARFEDANGKPVVDPTSNNELTVDRSIPVRRTSLGNTFGERTITEGIKLATALMIAVFGLMAGAQSQLEKLDILPGLVAVFLVGFSADSVKNLLTSKS
ncbi:MAG: hypothetical protein JWO13_422 [Acidobacteriales bacterium]|nr:hypothetical protein [Terriglobales bacterium]